jgi:SNF2 family DNA or RNA helicase
MPESSLLYKQALGRIDRIGQTRVPMYYYLVMEKTIDEDIYDMIEKKIEFSEEILDKLLLEDKI